MNKELLELVKSFEGDMGNIYELAAEVVSLQNQIIRKKLEDAGHTTAARLV